jgi:PTH2 family peptidyl-tRNA hydrolase
MATSANRDPPTILAYGVATAILAGLGGYFLGQASSLGLFGDHATREKAHTPRTAEEKTSSSASKAAPEDEESESEESDLSENDEDPDTDSQQDLAGFEDMATEECKLVLVVRTDLGMTKGRLRPSLPFPPRLTYRQVKSQHNAHTQHSPAIKRSPPCPKATSQHTTSFAAGNDTDKPRSPCKSRVRRSC